MQIEDMLILHEGMKRKPYKDTQGHLTIGVGRNLDSMGLSDDEVYYLLRNDIRRCENELTDTFDWFAGLDKIRKEAMINICFNVGITSLRRFSRALAAMEVGNYSLASTEFLDSLWASQVGRRAITLTNMIRTGEYDA